MIRFAHLRTFALCAITLIPGLASAQQLVLDEEFTQAAKTLAAPLRSTLAPNTNVNYVLVADPSINAFVTGENIVFIHSGLIEKAKNAGALQGVIAHELGHIAANHILQQEVHIKQAMLGSLATAALGMGAAAAGGGQAAAAIMMGGQAGAIQSLLAHTRTQEAEADNRALAALKSAGISAQGMVDMFTTLRTESQLSYDSPPPWLVTHPLPPERLATLTRATQNESDQLKSGLAKSEQSINFARLQAKVMALTSSPGSVLRKYRTSTEVDRYAKALAYVAQGNFPFADRHLSELLKAHPKDPFYRELEAKVALQKGDLGSAHVIYSDLVKEHPDYFLFRYQYAEILRNQEAFAEAIPHYKTVTRAWPEWADAWLGLGLCYGKLGRLAESHLARAQGFMVAPDANAARQSLALAKNYLKQKPDPDAEQWAAALQSRLDRMK